MIPVTLSYIVDLNGAKFCKVTARLPDGTTQAGVAPSVDAAVLALRAAVPAAAIDELVFTG